MRTQLPKKVLIPKTISINDEDSISDYLSDTYGFCHFGFSIITVRNKTYATDIKWDTSK